MLTLKNAGKEFAFTLAEVLITLGIIGVVSAMTMPTLIANYQKQVTVNKIKKFYTNINQVIAQAQVDNGEFSSWSYENSEDFYNKYIKPYIKNVDKVETNIHIAGDFLGGVRFVLADGTQAIFSSGSCFLGDCAMRPVIVFDIKVQKHNDTYSTYIKHPTRERFYFIIDKNGTVTFPRLTNNRTQNLSSCKKFNPNNGIDYGSNGYVTCSTVIYKDGWKIAPDYPW